jgi:hypothetical protein
VRRDGRERYGCCSPIAIASDDRHGITLALATTALRLEMAVERTLETEAAFFTDTLWPWNEEIMALTLTLVDRPICERSMRREKNRRAPLAELALGTMERVAADPVETLLASIFTVLSY